MTAKEWRVYLETQDFDYPVELVVDLERAEKALEEARATLKQIALEAIPERSES